MQNEDDIPLLLLFSCSAVSDSLWPRRLEPARLLCPWDSPGKNTRVGCHALLQGIFSTQGSNPSLLLWQEGPQHARPPCPSPTPRVHPNPCLLSRWCHPDISSFVIPFSSCPQSFSASRSFQMSQLFASGGQSIGVSASTSVLPVNTQDWSPLGWTGWISLQSRGLSRVFSNSQHLWRALRARFGSLTSCPLSALLLVQRSSGAFLPSWWMSG